MDTMTIDITTYTPTCEYPTCGELTETLTPSPWLFHSYAASAQCIVPMLCDECYDMVSGEIGDTYCYQCHPSYACEECAIADGKACYDTD